MSGQLSVKNPYRTLPPLQMVERIRSLLMKRDILTVETFHPPEDEGIVYRCDLSLGDPPFCGAGMSATDGGLSPRDALENAYLTFIARLSCGALVRDTLHPVEAGDAVDIPWRSFALDSPPNLMFGLGMKDEQELAAFLKGAYGETIRCVPYATEDGKTALLPRNMVRDLCGTAGLCAGNTREEAILRGLMDIYERYVTRKIYQFCFAAPAVAMDVFAEDGALAQIRRLGHAFAVYDCSLGKSFPVIGLALTRADGRRAFALGAAVSPELALERCLTRLLAGDRDAVERRFHQPGALDTQDRQRVSQAYRATVASSDGPWPDSIFGGRPLYPYTAWDTPPFDGAAQALRYFLDTVSQYGGTLYCRDCSVLGYPAYELYMPGASETDLNFTMTPGEFLLWAQLRRHRKTVFALPRATGAELERLAADLLAAHHTDIPIDLEPLAWLAQHPLPAGAPLRGAFLPLLYGATKRYALAADAMEAYLDTEEAQAAPRRFYQALMGFWQALAEGCPAHEAVRHLDAALAERCLRSQTVPSSLFSQYSWPVCPACDACAFVRCCVHPELRNLTRRMATEP